MIVVKSELQGIQAIINMVRRSYKVHGTTWMCSSTLADRLRERSWGKKIVGATVPHPFEMIQSAQRSIYCCDGTCTCKIKKSHVSVLVPKGMPGPNGNRGPYKAYLGSRTAESSTLLPFLPSSKLSRSMTGNLRALTEEDWEEEAHGAQRSGSALHRFSCSRQSQGGYIAQSPEPARSITCSSSI